MLSPSGSKKPPQRSQALIQDFNLVKGDTLQHARKITKTLKAPGMKFPVFSNVFSFLKLQQKHFGVIILPILKKLK